MIGTMRHKISVINVVSDADNGFEAPKFNDVTRFTTRAAIKEISRKDAMSHGLNVESNQYEVMIYNANNRIVELDDVVTWNNKRFQVRTSPSVVNLSNKAFLKFIITREYGS